MKNALKVEIVNNNLCKRCTTEFPIVLVHGTGFRDYKYINYWGRIPKALENEGAKVFYSKQDAWGNIEDNAQTIKNSILEILHNTGCKKVNLIAHSKGGLEARYMICNLGMEECIASLTTISTPHHGSKTMDLFYNAPVFIFKTVAFFVNIYFRILGDKNPDFQTTCKQLSSIYCREFNEKNINSPNIYYQSYASKMKSSFSDILLLVPHFITNLIEGDNDGLVQVDSAKWGDFKGIIKGKKLRGVSHADTVDLRRKNYSGIDIRDIYIDIVEDLKFKGF